MAAAAPSFVALSRDHFPLLVEWLARPHVAQWWTNPQGTTAVEDEFGPCVDGTDPTEVLLCAEGNQLVGLVQIYRLDDNPDYAAAVGLPDAAGIDLFVAEADRLGTGLGPAIIRAATALVWSRYPDVPRAMAGPSVRNTRSIRAFEKSGFTALGPVRVPGEEDEEMVLVCDRPTGV